jgi:hypothetical protein
MKAASFAPLAQKIVLYLMRNGAVDQAADRRLTNAHTRSQVGCPLGVAGFSASTVTLAPCGITNVAVWHDSMLPG